MSHRILIADDEPHIAELVRICLEDSGVRVLEARDGEAALAIARRERGPHAGIMILARSRQVMYNGLHALARRREWSAAGPAP